MNILMLIKTTSLDYDERIKKEVASLKKHNDVNITIFALEDFLSKQVLDDVQVINPEFIFRNKKTVVGKLLTLIEFFIRLNLSASVTKFDKIWIHDPIMFFNVPYFGLLGKRIIWDFHELPPTMILNNTILRKLFTLFVKSVETVIVANKERGEYMKSLKFIDSYTVICNYPSLDLSSSYEFGYKDEEFEVWASDKSYAYCQSATHPSRHFEQLVGSCIKEKVYLLVVGDKNDEYYRVKGLFEEFSTYIKVLGKKRSSTLNYYLERAAFSVVFYSSINMNNILCAPNRLYNSLALGIPVLTGKNPTMVDITRNYNCGHSIVTYGEDPEDTAKGIRNMISNLDYYTKNAFEAKNIFNWESQNSTFQNLLK